MRPHQERVIAESNDLREKMNKLEAFIGGEAFKDLDASDKDLLMRQHVFMGAYLDILRQRIALFT